MMPGEQTYLAFETDVIGSRTVSSIHQAYPVYALWKSRDISVRYHDGVSGANDFEKTHYYNTDDKLIANRFIRAGYAFIGWSTSNGSKEVSYLDREEVDPIILNENRSTLDLYAVWALDQDVVPVVYKGNGGTINGVKSLTIMIKKSTTPWNIVATKGSQANTGYLYADGSVVDLTEPVTKPVVIYANFGEGVGERLLTTFTVARHSIEGSSWIKSINSDGNIGATYVDSKVIDKEDRMTNKYQDEPEEEEEEERKSTVLLNEKKMVTEDRPTTNIYKTAVDTKKLNIKSVNREKTTWIKDVDTGRYKLSYVDDKGVKINFKDTFCQIVNKEITSTYYFDKNGNMVTGWMKTADGKWYYFNEEGGANEGVMSIGWTKIGKSWYYFTQNGSMQESGTTPDGESLGADGKWLPKEEIVA